MLWIAALLVTWTVVDALVVVGMARMAKGKTSGLTSTPPLRALAHTDMGPIPR
jgi:hypothetical protein